MAEPIRSPDGKFMWSGNEWIPTPPNDQGNQINMQDSVIGGDVISNTTINNDPSAVTSAVITALQQMGMITTPQPQSPPVHEVELPKSFDIGDHVEYHSPTNQRWLNRCKVVAINDDLSVARLKGSGRPINPVDRRMAVLAGLEAVDWVVSFDSDTPESLLKELRPDVLVKGGDYAIEGVVGGDFVKSYGGDVKVLNFIDDCSTSAIVDKIHELSS